MKSTISQNMQEWIIKLSDFLWDLFELKRRKLIFKRKTLIAILLCILAIGVGVWYFSSTAEEAPVGTPSLTAPTVVSVIQAYGAPSLDYFSAKSGHSRVLGSSYAVGYWAAIYEGNGYWKIQGDVVAVYKGSTTHYRTFWQYNEISNTIELIYISGGSADGGSAEKKSGELEIRTWERAQGE